MPDVTSVNHCERCMKAGVTVLFSTDECPLCRLLASDLRMSEKLRKHREVISQLRELLREE